MLLKKYKLNNNLNYYFHQTKKYKSFSIKIYFLLPYIKEKITIRNLLKDVLLYDSKKYSNTEIIDKKRELYNLKLSLTSGPINNIHQYCLTISGTNPKFFSDDEYTFKEIFNYLKEILFNPNTNKNKFNEESYQTCFNRYKTSLKTALEDKNFLASYESSELLDDDENKYCYVGYLKDFDNITNEDLYLEYQELINSNILIAISGDIDNKILKSNLNRLFKNFKEFEEKIVMTPTKYQEYREKIINLKTEQSIVIMNFATEIEKFKDNYFEILMFNMLFGGETNSKLFQIIREEYGYCYEIYSHFESSSGVITVYMGLDQENIDNAIALVKKQIEEIKLGNFTKENLKQQKTNEVVRVQNIYDSQQSTLVREISLHMFNRDTSLKVLKNDVKDIYKEDVMKVAHKLKHISTLIIKPKGDEDYANN